MGRIATHLCFDGQAEEAATFYTSIIEDSEIQEIASCSDGSVMVVTFELEGQQFIALNAGLRFTFTEATSVYVSCETQAEVDDLWAKLTEGGEEGPCGWLKDRYGVSWQIIPTALPTLLTDPDPEKASKVMTAMRDMKKIDIRGLREAYEQG